MSLKAWGLNKRAGKRLDSYFEVMGIGNDVLAAQILKDARKDVDQAIQLESSKWESYLNRGAILVQLKKLDAAAADFQKVSELAKSRSYGWFNLAELLYQKQDYAGALKNYEKSFEISLFSVITGVRSIYNILLR